MPYYPKNKILTNQVAATLDETFFVYASNLEPYNGFYYKLATGEMFTGKYPGDGKNEKIKMVSTLGGIDHANSVNVTPNISTSFTTTPPLFPTSDDYRFGSFIRYFSKKRNEYLFKELTQSQYNNLNSFRNLDFSLYKPFTLKWMLTGNSQTVTDFNFFSIRQTEEKEQVYGLNEFLQMNYTQYYKETV